MLSDVLGRLRPRSALQAVSSPHPGSARAFDDDQGGTEVRSEEQRARLEVYRSEMLANLARLQAMKEESPKPFEVRIWEALVDLFNNGADESYQALRRWFLRD